MANEGNVTVPLFHCVFNADGSISHWATSFDQQLYDALDHLYLVMLANDRSGRRAVPGAFMIRTSHHHDDPDFPESLVALRSWATPLQPHWSSDTKRLPGKVQLKGPPPTEKEFLTLAIQQFTKFSSAGSA